MPTQPAVSKPGPKAKGPTQPTVSNTKSVKGKAQPQAKKKSSASSQKIHKDTKLRAVLLANEYSHQSHFYPLTEHTPLCLFPWMNKPLLIVHLHQLKEAAFHEVIVYCSSHCEKVKSAILEEGFSLASGTEKHDETSANTFQVRLVCNVQAASVGDALRDLAEQQLILSDFVLFSANLVSNVSPQVLMQQHRLTSTRTPHPLLSMVYQVPPSSSSVLGGQLVAWRDCDFQLVVKPQKESEIVHLHHSSQGVTVPHRLLCEISGPLRILANVMDTGLVLCEPYVATLFQDNYDYGSVSDVALGVLHNPDILDCTLHALRSSPEDVMVPLRHVGLYLTLQRLSMAHRVTHLSPTQRPFCLTVHRGVHDSTATGATVYHPQGHLSPKVFPQGVLHSGTVIYGQDCIVGKDCHLKNVVMGSGCVLEDNVRVADAVFWRWVHLGRSCEVRGNCLLCDEVRLGEGCHVGENCVLDKACVLPPGTRVPPNSLVTKSGASGFEVHSKPPIVHYLHWLQGRTQTTPAAPRHNNRGDSTENQKESSLSEESDSANEFEDSDNLSERSTDEEVEENEGLEEERQFVAELQQTWTREVACQNTVLEVNALKHAYNIEIDTLYMLLGRALVDQAFRSVTLPEPGATFPAAEFKKHLESLTTQVKEVIQHYITPSAFDTQMNFLQGVEEYVADSAQLMTSTNAVNYIFHTLYDQDLVLDTVILQWRDSSPLLKDEELAPKLADLRNKLKPLLDWLENDEDDSDE